MLIELGIQVVIHGLSKPGIFFERLGPDKLHFRVLRCTQSNGHTFVKTKPKRCGRVTGRWILGTESDGFSISLEQSISDLKLRM